MQKSGRSLAAPEDGAFTVTVTASETVPSLGQAAGLDAVAFPDTVSQGDVYTQGGALTATVDHLYTFDASDTVSGTYALTVTDRAANETTVPFQVVRDAISPTVFLTVPARSVSTTIPVQWSATDSESGVRDYDVWYRVDDGDWVLWMDDTQSTQDTYSGDLGHTYAFRVQATDRVSNTSAFVTATVKTAVVKKYYHVAGQRVAMRANGVLYYLHSDHLGSTSLTTTDGGALHTEQRYYPYGEVRWTNGTLPTDYTYTGQRAEDFGLMDYKARYYSPCLGRFISPDTLVPDPTKSMEFNRYGYCLANPINFIDPTGHQVRFSEDNGGLDFGPPPREGGLLSQLWTNAKGWVSRTWRGLTTGNWTARTGGLTTVNVSVSGSGATGTGSSASSSTGQGTSSGAGSQPVAGSELPDDATVYQYQKNMPKPGKTPTFSDVPRPGESAISCQYGPACGNSPKQGLENAFPQRGLPRPGEHYRTTTIGQIRDAGRTPDFDAGQIVDGREMPPGHLSIYGTSDPVGFGLIWSDPIPFDGPFFTE